MTKVSIIVPVFNVENTLERCLETLINQTLKEIEIILVNDGSTDNSQMIIDKYLKIDNKIKAYLKENGGLSDARNYGLKKAEGKYVLFVDSDDYISLDTCEKFYDIAEKNKLDVVIGDYISVNSKGNQKIVKKDKRLLNKIYKGDEYLKECLKYKCAWMMAWLNFCRREFLIENDLYFVKGRIHEDERWTPIILLNANKVMYIDINFYYYSYNFNSIMNKKDTSNNTINMFQNCIELEKIYNELKDEELKNLLLDSLVEKYLSSFYTGKFYKRKYRVYLNDDFLEGKAYTNKTKKKLSLYKFNRTIYYYINYFTKMLKNIGRK